MRWSGLVAIVIWIQPAAAQEPPPAPPPGPAVLENTGKPMSVEFACTVEDIQAAGLTCSEQDPCPVYLELTGVESVGGRIFVTGNFHSAAVTLFSELLGSMDGGRTWRQLHERIRSASLDRIQFADSQTGWAAGEVFSPLPQDPFLLLTSDGGETWRERPVFGEDAEDHMGAVQQFWFTDKSTGKLIIDRGQGSGNDEYELYESPNGGESWTIRQSSARPLRLPAEAGAEAGGWRLRADRASKSFQVEHRLGGEWRAAASFLVNAGVCRP
ncbi:MAG TPA: hypothetical protein VMA31_09625 [Bryobacteraceae bacterium]|nr:hypothetical protein [Bryobacteraceae bacterium]